MSIVAVIGKISGTGKTMAAVLLASEWAYRELRVLLLDADPIALSLYWGGLARVQAEPHPDVEDLETALATRTIGELASAYDRIIIDCPPLEDDALLRVLSMVDLAIVPCCARWSNVEALSAVAALTARGAVDAVTLISRRSLDRPFEEGVEAAIKHGGLPVLETHLHQRVILQQAFESGSGVRDFAPCSPAEAEIEAIVAELDARLGSHRR